MKSKVFIYVFKVWITALLLGTLLIEIYLSVKYDGGLGVWLFFGVLFGGGLSAPSMILLWLTAVGLMKRRVGSNAIKLYLSIISIVLVLFPFAIGYDLKKFLSEATLLYPPYLVVTIGAIWVYKLDASAIYLN